MIRDFDCDFEVGSSRPTLAVAVIVKEGEEGSKER